MTNHRETSPINLFQTSSQQQSIFDPYRFNIDDDNDEDVEENYIQSVRRKEAVTLTDTDAILLTRTHSDSPYSSEPNLVDEREEESQDLNPGCGVDTAVTYDPVRSMREEAEIKEHINYVVMMAMFYFEMPSKFYDKVNRSRTLLKLLPRFDHTKKHLAQDMFLQERFTVVGGNSGSGVMSATDSGPLLIDGDVKVPKTWPDHVVQIQEELREKEKEDEEKEKGKNVGKKKKKKK